MDAKTHWEKVYRNNKPEAVSWYRPHLETSLELIERATDERSASIIDVGGGESTLVDDLLLRGYLNLTVLDVSQTAIDLTKDRLGSVAEQVHWLVGDIIEIELQPCAFDLWHDRAAFHFLTAPERRTAYVRQVEHSVKPGGRVIVSTFGPEGPTKCSGLEVMRYDAESLHHEFGAHFRLVEVSTELHRASFGTVQQFRLRLNTMILPNGYTVDFTAIPTNTGTGGNEGTNSEGNIHSDTDIGTDVGTVLKTTGIGAAIGGISSDHSGAGAGIGAGAGAAVGLAMVLLMRGPEAVLPQGTTVDVILDRSVYLDASRVNFTDLGHSSNLPGPANREPRVVDHPFS